MLEGRFGRRQESVWFVFRCVGPHDPKENGNAAWTVQVEERKPHGAVGVQHKTNGWFYFRFLELTAPLKERQTEQLL